MKNDFEIRLEEFKGPLDLLLHLLEKNKIDIYDIPIVDITKQYMDFIESAENKLTVASEFLVMAATLISIKTKMLLPRHEEDEQDPRTELVQQLLEYKCFKEVGEKLKEFEKIGQQSIVRSASIPNEVKIFEYKPDVDELFKNISIEKLENIFIEAIKRAEYRVDERRANFGKIEDDLWTVEEMMVQLRKDMKKGQSKKLSLILSQTKSKLHIIVTFLAILEMIKFGEMKIVDIYDDDIEVIGG